MALKGLAKLLDEAVNAVFTTGKHFENLSKPMRDELAKIFKQSDNLKDDVADWVKKNDASLPDNVKSYLGSNTFESTIGRLKGIKSFGDDFTSLLKSADYDIAGKSQDLLKRLEGWLPRGQYDDMAAQMGRQASRRTKAIDDIMNQSSFRAANSGLTQAQLQAKATTEYLTRMDTLAARTGAAIRATPGAVASGVGTAARVTGQALWSKPGIIITSFAAGPVIGYLTSGWEGSDGSDYDKNMGAMRQMVVMSGFAQASLSGVDETFRNKFSQFLLSDEFGSKSGADLERLANEWRTSELANPYGANERAFLNSPEFMKLVQAQDQLDHLCTRFDNAFHSDAPTFNIDQMFADFKQNNGILVDRELSAIKSGFEFTTEGGDKTDVNGLQKLLDERTNGIKKVIQDNPSLRANNNASITAYLESIGEDFRGRQSDIGALGPAAGGPAAGGPAAGGPAAGGPAAGGPAAGGAGAGGPAAGGAAAGGSSTGTGTGTGGSAAGTPPAPPVPTFTGLLAEQERDAYNRMQQLGNLVTEVGVTFLNGDGNAGNGLAAAEIVAQSNMLQTSLITMAGELRADGKADQAARIDAFAARFAKDAVNAEVGRQAIEVMNDSVKALQAQAKAFQDQIKALNTQSGTLQQTIATAETKEAEKSAEAEQKLRALETTLGIAETDIARKTVQERIDAAQALINAETDEDKKTALTGELAAIEGTNTAAEAAAQAKVTATAQIETLKTKASELVEKIGDNLESIAQHRDDAAAQLDVLRVASWEIQEQLRQDDEGKKLFRGGDRPGSFADGVASFAGDNNLISGLFGSDGDDPSIISGVYDSVRAGMGDINQWWQSVKRGATSKEEAMLYNALETGTLVIGGMAAWNVVKNLSSAIGVEIPKGVSWAVVGLIAIYALKHSGVIGGEMADNITKNLNGELVTAYGQGKGAHNPPRPIASVDAARRLAGIQPPPAAGTPAAAGTTPAAGAGTPVAGSLSLTEIRTALEPTYTSMIQKFTTSGVSEQNMAYGALIAGSIEKAMADTGIQDADIPRVKAFMEKLGQDIIANGQKPEQLNVAKAFIEQIQAGKVAMPTVKQIREADGLFISIDDRKIRTFKLNAAGAPEIGDVIELSSQGQQYVENKLNAAAGVVQGSGSRIPASFYTQSPEPLQSVVAAANGDPAEIFQLRMDLQRDGTPRITAAAAN